MSEFIEFNSWVLKYLRKSKPQRVKSFYKAISREYRDLVVGRHRFASEHVKKRLIALTGIQGIGELSTLLQHFSSTNGHKRPDVAVGLYFLAKVDNEFEAVAEGIEKALFRRAKLYPETFKEEIGRDPPKKLESQTTEQGQTSHANAHSKQFENLNSGVAVSSIPTKPTAPFSRPPYKSEDDVRRLLEKNEDDGIWLDPHNHHSIPMYPRAEEEFRLTQFMKSNEPLRIFPVIGPSGSGKTRLISEWMKPYVATSNDAVWDAGFLISNNPNARDPKKWSEWTVDRNTLIVVDYTHAFVDVVRTIIEKDLSSVRHKIRIIVIDHVMPDFLHSDFFWRGLGGDHASTLDTIRSITEEPIELRSEKDNSQFLKHVISKSAGLGGKEYKIDDPIVDEALQHLDRMGNGRGDLDAVRHPLFAALIGQAIRVSGEQPADFGTWSRRDLITYYFTSKDRLPWAGWSENRKEHIAEGLLVGALVATATLRQDLHVLDAEHFLIGDHRGIIQKANRITSSDDPHIIERLLPDILGETFLLKFLERIQDEKEIYSTFISLLSKYGAADEEHITLSFNASITRLARNLANENPGREDTVASWKALSSFLNPERFAQNSALRVAVSYIIPNILKFLGGVIERLENERGKLRNSGGPRQANKISALIRRFIDIHVKLEQNFSSSDVESSIEEGNLKDAVSSVFDFFEHSRSSRINLGELVKRFAIRFTEQNIDGWNATCLAADRGNLRVTKLITEDLSEEINKSTNDGRTVLGLAIQSNNFPVVEYLLEKGANPNLPQDRASDITPLFLAVNNLEIFKALRTYGADVRHKAFSLDETLIHWCAKSGSGDVLDYLIVDLGFDINSTDIYDATPMHHVAFASDNPARLSRVIKRGGFVDAVGRVYIGALDMDLRTPMHISAILGHSKQIEEFVRSTEGANLSNENRISVDVNFPLKSGLDDGLVAAGPILIGSQLFFDVVAEACANGGEDTVRLYLNYELDAERKTVVGGFNLMMVAARNGHEDIVCLLVERQANVDAVNDYGNTSLMLAAEVGHFDVVNVLCHEGADIDADCSGGTALMMASQNGHTNIVELLLFKQANVNSTLENNGETALMMAAEKGHAEIVALLLNEKADPKKACFREGETALMMAASRGMLKVVRILLDEASSVNFATEKGLTALMFAAQQGHSGVVEAFVGHPEVNLGLKSKDGITPLMMAVSGGSLECVDCLVKDARIDINASAVDNTTALYLATARGMIDCVTTLLGLGANPLMNIGGGMLLSQYGYEVTKSEELRDILARGENAWLRAVETGEHS